MVLHIAIDLTPGKAFAQASAIVRDKYYSGVTTSVNFGSDWVFDSSTKITVCSNQNGNYPIACNVQNPKFTYKIPDQDMAMSFSNTRKPYYSWVLNLIG